MIQIWWLVPVVIVSFVGGAGFWHWMLVEDNPWQSNPNYSPPPDSKYYDG